MKDNFTYDQSTQTHPRANERTARSAKETFSIKSGVCWDGARFIKEALDKINPAYEARMVLVGFPGCVMHYVCSLKVDGKLYIMDYANPIRIGTYGPFESLEDYKRVSKAHTACFVDKDFKELK